MTPAMTYHRLVRDFKRATIRAALARHRNNRTCAARALGLQRTYLHRLMRDLKITAPVTTR